MELSILTVRAALQGGLLCAITPNIRLVTTSFTDHSIDIYFYYDQPPSEEEEELSEVVSTEVMCNFREMPSTQVHRFVLPYPKILPKDKDKISVYYRYELTPPENEW